MNTSIPRRRRLVHLLAATGVASALALSACGSDESASDDTTAAAPQDKAAATPAPTTAGTTAATTADTTEAEPADTTAGTASGDGADATAVCDSVIELDQTVPTGQATKEQANELLDTAIGAADADTASMLTAFQEAVQPVLDDPEGEPPEEFFVQYSELLGWVGENCDVATIDVHAEEYHFMGLPEELDADYYIVNFTNDGNEAHELGVARINDDVTLTIDELLALPEAESDTMIQFIGGIFAPPGATTVGSLTLTEPGRYGAVCFIPTGTTADAEGTGPPHAMQGMVQEFTVA